MKKKIISSILAVAMLATMAVPTMFAANSDVAGSYAKVTKITEKEGKDTWTLEVGKEFKIEDHINVYENETKLVLDKGQIRYELNGPTGEYNGFKLTGSTLVATQANREAVLTVYDNYNKSTTNARVDIKIKSTEAAGGGVAESFTFKTAANELPVTVDRRNGEAEKREIVVQSHPKDSVFSDRAIQEFRDNALWQIQADLLGTTTTSGKLTGLFAQKSSSAKGIFEVDLAGTEIAVGEPTAAVAAVYTSPTLTAGTANDMVVTITNALASGSFVSSTIDAGTITTIATQLAEIARLYNLKTDRLYTATSTATALILTANDAGAITSAPVITAAGTTATFASAGAFTVTTAGANMVPANANIAVTIGGNATSQTTNTPANSADGKKITTQAIVAALVNAHVTVSFGGETYTATGTKTGNGNVLVFESTNNGPFTNGSTIPAVNAPTVLSATDGTVGTYANVTNPSNRMVNIVSNGSTLNTNATITYDFSTLTKMPAADTDLYFEYFGTLAHYRVAGTDTLANLAQNAAANLSGKVGAWTPSHIGQKLIFTSTTNLDVLPVPTSAQLAINVPTGTSSTMKLTATPNDARTEITVTVPAELLDVIYDTNYDVFNKVVGAANATSGAFRYLNKSFVVDVEMPRFDGKVPAFKASTNATYTEAIKAVSWQVPQMNYEIEVGQTIKIPVTYYPPQANVGKKTTFEPASVLNNGKPFMYATLDADNSNAAEVTDELKVIGVNSTETAKTNFKGMVKNGTYTAFFSVAVKPTTYKPTGTPEYTSKISTTALEVEAGKIAPVTISNLPQGVTVKWTHKDDGTMNLNKAEGPAVVVYGKKVGTNVLTASLSNGETFTVAVTVKAATAVAPVAPGTGAGTGTGTNVPQTGDSLFANLF